MYGFYLREVLETLTIWRKTFLQYCKTKILQNPKDLFPVYISLPYCHSDQLIPDLHSVVSITLRPLCSTLVESCGWGKPDMNAEMTLIGFDLSCHDLFGSSAKHRILGHHGSLAAWCWLLKFICLWYLSFKIYFDQTIFHQFWAISDWGWKWSAICSAKKCRSKM